jgi:hypothetical protein
MGIISETQIGLFVIIRGVSQKFIPSADGIAIVFPARMGMTVTILKEELVGMRMRLLATVTRPQILQMKMMTALGAAKVTCR